MATYNEILKLHEKLSGHKVPHGFYDCVDGYQITYPPRENGEVYFGVKISVIEHMYSYGGRHDMLEIWDRRRRNTQPEGCVTAEYAFEVIRGAYESEKKPTQVGI